MLEALKDFDQSMTESQYQSMASKLIDISDSFKNSLLAQVTPTANLKEQQKILIIKKQYDAGVNAIRSQMATSIPDVGKMIQSKL